MDIHNLDEYLDLQDQNQMNLLSTEELAEPEPKEAEWHAGGSLDTLLDPTTYLFNENNTNADWGLLQNGLVDGINLTEIIGNGGILVSNQDNFITPDSLFKQQPVVNEEEKRVTRSRAGSTPKAAVTKPAPKKKKKATKKLYCICQQPYNGKPMVQCDTCEEWFHCSCVDFDPDDQEGEDIDWVCKKCLEDKQIEPKIEPEQKVITTTEEKPAETSASEPSPTAVVTPAPQPKVTITIPAPSSTRQTRGSNRNQSQCLYSGCNNRTRADSYCSDVCARKKDEEKMVKEEKAPRVTRTSRMRTASMSGDVSKGRRANGTKKSPPDVAKDEEDEVKTKENDTEYKEEDDAEEEEDEKEEEEEKEDDEREKNGKEKAEKEVEMEEEEEGGGGGGGGGGRPREGTETPDTPMSPSQMTEHENPVRRNVIKNMSNILKVIIDSALTENPDLFDSEEKISNEERADKLARSIENTMLEQLGDSKQQRQRTCGERYKSKFRSLLYNLKDKQNKVFQVRVITGDLSPSELVKMSSEDMANPELKSMSEVLRKTALKNSVMKMDNTPIIKKTHKGDIIMVPNKDNDTNQNMYSEQVENIHIEKPIIPTTPSPSITDSPKTDDQQQQLEHHRTSISSFSPTSTGSKLDPLDDILARIGIPAHDDHGKRGSSDASAADQIKKRKVTLDVAELLGEEEESSFEVEEVDTSELLQPEEQSEDVEMEEVQEEEKVTTKEEEEEEDVLPTIWQGRVNMPQVAEFEASARQIGGRLLSETEWAEVLSSNMWIEGRIPAERVTSYVTQSQYSSSREIVLLEIDPDTNDPSKPKETQQLNETQSQKLLKYLDSRQRYAVVGHNKTKVKDFYLIPLYKVQHIPDCLYVVRVEETKRKCDLFLGVLVLTKTAAAATTTTTTVPKPVATAKPTLPPAKQQVYSTPMAQPMYLSTQTYPNSYQPPTTTSNYQPPVPTTNNYQPPVPNTNNYQPPAPNTNSYQPPVSTTNNYHQPPIANHYNQQQPRQEYGYGYQKTSYGRQPPNNNQNNQRNQYGSYNQRNQNNYGASHYRPSY